MRIPALDVPYLTNLRLDPFERTGWPDSGTKNGAQQYFDWFKYEFWRFVLRLSRRWDHLSPHRTAESSTHAYQRTVANAYR